MASPPPLHRRMADLAGAAVAETIRHRPVVWLTVSFVLGIVIADQWLPAVAVWCAVAGGAVLLALVTLSRAGEGLPTEVALAVLALGVGGALHAGRLVVAGDDISRHIGAAGVTVTGTLVRDPTTGPHWTHLVLEVSAVGGVRASGSASVLLSDKHTDLAAGNVVQLRGSAISPVHSTTRPGSADPAKAARREGIHADISARGITVSPDRKGGLLAGIGSHLRERALDSLRRAMPPPAELNASLLAAMVIGAAASDLPRSIFDDFRRTGIVHLLVVSGAQVTMLVSTVLFLITGGSRHHRWWHFLPVLPLLVLLLLAAGPGVSLWRAIIMSALWCAAIISRRSYDAATAIAISAAVLCLADTTAVFAVGAQLSFAATIGVIVMLPRSERDDLDRPRPVPTWAHVVSGSFGAWLFTTPLVAFHFGCFAMLGALANLIAVPLSLLIMPLGMLTICLGLADYAAAIPGCAVCKALVDILQASNAWFGALPGAFVDHVNFPAWLCGAWFAGAVVIALVVQANRRYAWWRVDATWLIIAAGAIVTLIILVHALRAPVASRDLTVSILDVGDGQCVVANGPGGAALIDAGSMSESPGMGPDIAHSTIIPHLVGQRVGPLQAIIVSHPHADHCNAVADVIRGWPVRALWLSPNEVGADSLREAANLMRTRGAVSEVRAGDGSTQLGLRVIGPLMQYRQSRESENDNALVVALQFGRVRFLFPADAEVRAQEDLVVAAEAGQLSLRADVLIAPHHGRKSATDPGLLRLVHPRYVVISTAPGPGGADTVDPAFLQCLHGLGAQVLRTDEAGTVTFRSDGEGLEVETERR